MTSFLYIDVLDSLPTTDSDVTRSFDEASAVIRLAHKYHIQSVQDQGIHALHDSPCTSDFEVVNCPPKRWIFVRGNEYIGAVNLARLTDTPLMLPFALYQYFISAVTSSTAGHAKTALSSTHAWRTSSAASTGASCSDRINVSSYPVSSSRSPRASAWRRGSALHASAALRAGF